MSWNAINVCLCNTHICLLGLTDAVHWMTSLHFSAPVSNLNHSPAPLSSQSCRSNSSSSSCRFTRAPWAGKKTRKQVIFWFAWREKTVEWWPSKTFSVFQFSTGKLPLGRNGKLEKKENRERKKNKRVDWNHSVLKKGWWLFWPSYTWLEIRVQWHYMKRKRRRRGGKEKTRQRRGGST